MSYVKYLRDVLGEGFKEFVAKFSDRDEKINFYVDKFKLLKTRNKIKGVEADIDHWIKKDFDSFKTFIDSFDESKIKSRKEVKKEAYKNMVAENEEYVIIKIISADEMYAVGKGTVWCVASGEKETAEKHYAQYTEDSNFYVAIKKNLGEMKMVEVAHGANNEGQAMIYPYWDKIAIQVKLGDDIVYWNAGDFNHVEGSEELSKVNLPKYDFKYEFMIPRDWKLNEDGSYDVEGDVFITNVMLDGGKFPVKFGRVLKTFYCSGCTSLTSLEGSPKSVGGDFNCSGCTSLTSLEGSPESVVGSFDCTYCTSLTSLVDAPERIGGVFNCSDCTSLTSLEGSPESVVGSFYCAGCTSLTSLEGAPKSVNRFNCVGCTSLTSLEGAPENVVDLFYCGRCPKLKLSELDKIPLSYRYKVIHTMKESTFYYWNKTYNKLNG